MITDSAITCPSCGHQAVETMPINACQIFYDCEGCGTRLKPEAGRLLCVLRIRIGAVPTGSADAALLFEARLRSPPRVTAGDALARADAEDATEH